MKLRYTLQAAQELDEVLTFISERSPQGSIRVQSSIKKAIDVLLEHPLSGQKTDHVGLRRLVVTPYPYLIYYQATEEAVVIIGVRHAARDPLLMPEAP